MTRWFLTPLFVVLIGSAVSAQPDPFAGYQAERDQAARYFPASILKPAEDLAAKARDLQKSNPAASARLIRDARWQLPYVPSGLPDHVRTVLGGARMRHADRVNAVAYSPDGRFLASASRDGTAKIWQLDNGREVLSYRGLADLGPPADAAVQDNVLRVTDIAYSPTDRILAVSGYQEIHLIDPSTGKLIHTLTGHKGTVKALSFRPDGKRLATVGDDKTIRFWDPATGKETDKIEPGKPGPNQAAVAISRFESIAYGPKGDILAVANQDGRVWVYDLSGEKPKLRQHVTVVGQTSAVYCVRFTPDGTGLLTGSESNNPPRITAAPSKDAVAGSGSAPAIRVFNGSEGRVASLDMTRDGVLVVTGSSDKSVRVWEANTGKPLRRYSAHTAEVLAVAIRPDGKEVASADENGVIRVWPLGAYDDHTVSNEATDIVWTIAVSPAGTRYAAAGADRQIRVYDTTDGKLLRTLAGHTSSITSLTFLTETTLASGGGDRIARVWDLTSGSTIKEFKGHTSVILSLTSAEGGKLLITGSADRSAKVWDVASGRELTRYDAKSAVCAVASSVTGNRIVLGLADGWINLLELQGEKLTLRDAVAGHAAGVSGVTLKADGSEAVSVGGDGMTRMWTISDKKTFVSRASFDGIVNAATGMAFPLSTVSYAANGKSFAAAGQDGLIRLYDAAQARESRTFRGHTDWVSAVAVAPDGKTVFGGGIDKSVRRFPLGEQEIATLPGHSRGVNCAATSPDGKTVATAGPDELKLWDLASGTNTASLPLGDNAEPNSVVFTSNTVVVVGLKRGRILWFDIATGKQTRSEPSGDSAYSVNGEGSNLIVWQIRQKLNELVAFTEPGKPVSKPMSLKAPNNGITCVSLCPDGRHAVAGQDDGHVQYVEITKAEVLGGPWKLFEKRVVDLGITSDRSTIVGIDEAGTIQVADVSKRSVTAKAQAHPKGCNGIIVSRSGNRFATLGVDGEVKAWDMAAKELRSWQLPGEIRSAAFTPDGKTLITANGDGSSFVLLVP